MEQREKNRQWVACLAFSVGEVGPCSAKVFLSSLCIIQGLNQQGVKSYGETNVPSTTQKMLI